MIRNSFIFLDRVGYRKEKSIWEQGVKDWNTFIKAKKIRGISDKAKGFYNRKIIEANNAILENNAGYFIGKLPAVENWRLYNEFKDEAVFLDIEASRVGEEGFITVIGLCDGEKTMQMVKGINLDFQKLKKILRNYKIIITFNGSSFDLPFIRKRYPDVIPDVPHIDLKHLCQRLGYNGGLKEVEKELGIKRQNEIVERMYGGDPYLLWRMYRGSGDEIYLRLLLEYNEEDVVNLERIFELLIVKN